jgi:hypothetical protein
MYHNGTEGGTVHASTRQSALVGKAFRGGTHIVTMTTLHNAIDLHLPNKIDTNPALHVYCVPDIFSYILNPSCRCKCHSRSLAILGLRHLAEKCRDLPASSQASIHEHTILYIRDNMSHVPKKNTTCTHTNSTPNIPRWSFIWP